MQVPGGLQNPHDIAVSADGGTLYVVELQPFVVWKLTNGGPYQQPTNQPQNVVQFLLGLLG
jgi:sugar lactone lactonase YvrE